MEGPGAPNMPYTRARQRPTRRFEAACEKWRETAAGPKKLSRQRFSQRKHMEGASRAPRTAPAPRRERRKSASPRALLLRAARVFCASVAASETQTPNFRLRESSARFRRFPGHRPASRWRRASVNREAGRGRAAHKPPRACAPALTRKAPRERPHGSVRPVADAGLGIPPPALDALSHLPGALPVPAEPRIIGMGRTMISIAAR